MNVDLTALVGELDGQGLDALATALSCAASKEFDRIWDGPAAGRSYHLARWKALAAATDYVENQHLYRQFVGSA